MGEVRTDTVTGQSMVWDGICWVSDPSPGRDLGMHVEYDSDVVRDGVDELQRSLRSRRSGDHPVYLVPERRAHFLYTAEELSLTTTNMDEVPEKTIVIGADASIRQALSVRGQRQWYSLGRAVHPGVALELAGYSGRVVMREDAFRAHLGVARMSMEDLVLLVSYWYVENPDQAEELRNSFWDDLLVQMHRPAPRREAIMQITKTPTRRGRASDRAVDPLTPWALRAGAEKLLADVTDDTRAGDHGSDAAYLKRVLDIRRRREQLLEQLNEVDGYLQTTEAILLSQKVSA